MGLNRDSFTRKAKQFSKSVKLNKTYYSLEEHVSPGGGGSDDVLLHEWVFTKRSFLTGEAMCGHMSATAVFFYTGGSITANRPRGYRTVQEQSVLNNQSSIPLEGYDPPPGWTFKEGSDPEDLWEEFNEWRNKRR